MMLGGRAKPLMVPAMDCLAGRVLEVLLLGGPIEGLAARGRIRGGFAALVEEVLLGVLLPEDRYAGCFVGDFEGD